jgi:hypothetical protein
MAKRKNFGLKNFFFSLAAVCLSFYIFQNVNGSVETIVAENGNLEDVIKAYGIIIKDEKVYNASVSGNVTYFCEDGTKVREGQLIVDLNTDTNAADISKQIAEIQTAIDKKKNTGNSVVSLSNETLVSYENEIQASILNNELNSMYNIVGQVNNSIGIASYENSYEQFDTAQLETMKASLNSSISTNKVPYYSGQSGLVSFKIDGLENEYKYEDVLSMTPSSTVKKEVTVSDKKQSSIAEVNEGIFKIIKNFDYYIVATVDNEKAKLFSENKFIKTRVISDSAEHEVWGYIKKINYGSEQSVLILYFDDYFYKIYDKRYVDLELITDIYEGIKINTKSLIQKDGLYGVYVQDASNIIKFFPVEILGKDENFTIISTGEYIGEHDRRIIQINDKAYPTVKIFDKIILEPENVYDGQIAD